MTESAQKCSLCDQSPHTEPLAASYGLLCPGEAASLPEQDRYLAAYAAAVTVAERYGTEVASDPQVVADIWARQQAGVDRFDPDKRPARSLISHEQLAEDINRRTPNVVAAIAVETLIETAQDDLTMPAHLSVEVRAEDVRTAAHKMASGNTAKHALHTDDYSLYFPSDE